MKGLAAALLFLFVVGFVVLLVVALLLDAASAALRSEMGQFVLFCIAVGTVVTTVFIIIQTRRARRREIPIVLRYRADNRPFVLLLGSFARTLDDAETSTTGIDRHDASPNFTEWNLERFGQRFRPVEEFLSTLDAYPIVRLGGKAVRPIVVIDIPPNLWYAAFSELSKTAKAIVVVPGMSQALTTELRCLIEDGALLEKLAILQPPGLPKESEYTQEELQSIGRYSAGKYPDFPSTSRDREWKNIVKRFQDLGIVLPDYEQQGQVVVITTGRIAVSQPLSELRRVVDNFSATEVPLSAALSELQEHLFLEPHDDPNPPTAKLKDDTLAL